jgi:hypothetical protein
MMSLLSWKHIKKNSGKSPSKLMEEVSTDFNSHGGLINRDLKPFISRRIYKACLNISRHIIKGVLV